MNEELPSGCLWVIAIFVLCAVLGAFGVGSKMPEGSDNRGYNDSVPAGMERWESNYIGNTASENGYSEEDAKKIRDAIHNFNEAQK